jgi:DNA-binding winged helix-turn-helix (wHTH) protein
LSLFRIDADVVKTFGSFEFDARRRTLRAAGQPVRLSGQALDVLCLLLERPGELVTREDIERALWPDRHVNVDHSLDVIISRLRAVLDDRGPRARYIETVPRRGYRFIEPVATKVESEPTAVDALESAAKVESAAKIDGQTKVDGETQRVRHWSRRLATYAAIALLAAMLAVLYARTRYDKFVPDGRAPASSTSAVSSRAPQR